MKLLQRLALPTDYRYTIFFYGPYSDGLFRDIGEYEFWTFDLETYRVINRTPFRGRPRMSLRVSSDGKTIYIYQAGNTIDLYDAATFKLLRTITLDGDMTTDLFVFPAASTTKPSQ